MKTASLPKFEWSGIDKKNSGYTKDELEKQKDAPKTNIIETYDIKWNTNKTIREPN
jgi:hypothetical protein